MKKGIYLSLLMAGMLLMGCQRTTCLLYTSVIVEEAGSGSEYAVPIAKKIFDAYYN